MAKSTMKIKSYKAGVFKGGAAPGPNVATVVGAKKQGPKTGKAAKGGKGC